MGWPEDQGGRDVNDLIEPDRFYLYAPPWVVCPAFAIAVGESGLPLLLVEESILLVGGTAPEGHTKAILAFTDRDLAETFISTLPRRQEPATFRSLNHFAAFLRGAQARGLTYIVFDSIKPARFVPIQRVIDAIAQAKA
jgi:hypothetical protein